MTEHKKYMQRCITLARLGLGNTQSNPLVGAVLVYKDTIIGEGFHAKYGQAHAEVNCLRSVPYSHQEYIAQSTLYVNLEPCHHTGKTPPCTHAIIKAGIKRVVIGTPDPNPLVDSKGIQFLKKNKVDVIVIKEKECYSLNRVFFTNQINKRSYVKLKWAQSRDGFIGNENMRIAISSERTNIINHKYRTQVDGVLVGFQTARLDKPLLNARHWIGQQPTRIFIDWQLDLPQTTLYKKGYKNIVLTCKEMKSTQEITYIQVEKNATSITEALYENNITSILVEGGAQTHQLFIDEGLWDEAIVIESAKDLNLSQTIHDANVKAAVLKKSRLVHTGQIEDDLIRHYSNSEFI